MLWVAIAVVAALAYAIFALWFAQIVGRMSDDYPPF